MGIFDIFPGSGASAEEKKQNELAAKALADRQAKEAETARLNRAEEERQERESNSEFEEQQSLVAGEGQSFVPEDELPPPPKPPKKKGKKNSKKKSGSGNIKGGCKEPNKKGTRRYLANEKNTLKKWLKEGTLTNAEYNARVTKANKTFRRHKHKYIGLSGGCDPEAALVTAQTEQNFIMQNVEKLNKFKGSPSAQTLKNLVLVKSSSGANMMNTITSSRKLGPLFCASSLDLSKLVPYIRIYKKTSSSPAESTMEEFRFEGNLRAFFDAEGGMLASRNSYGAGVGLKSFRWHTTGTNLFTAPRTLRATLSLFFQTISDFNKSASENPDDPNAPPRWFELLVQQGTKRTTTVEKCTTKPLAQQDLENKTKKMGSKLSLLQRVNQDFDNADHPSQQPPKRDIYPVIKIVADVGWAYSKKSDLDENLKDAIDKSKVTLTLGYENHDIKFAEDGSVTVDISYIASLDNAMEGYSANIFNLDENGKGGEEFKAFEQQQAVVNNYDYTINSPGGYDECAYKNARSDDAKDAAEKKQEKDQKVLDKLKKVLEGRKRLLKSSIYGKFIQHLMQNGKLWSIVGSDTDFIAGLFDSFEQNSPSAGERGAAAAGGGVSSEGVTEASRILTQTIDDVEKVNEANLAKYISNAVEVCQEPLKEGERRINFFYFGDLLNFYANAMKATESGTPPFQIVLGDMVFLSDDKKSKGSLAVQADKIMDELLVRNIFAGDNYIDPESAAMQERIDEAVQSAKDNYVPVQISTSMARIPISLDLYSMWFTRAVTNGEDVFTFKRFLQEITSKLLVAALQPHNPDDISDVERVLREKAKPRVNIISGINDKLRPGKERKDSPLVNGESPLLITHAGNAADFKEYLVISATYLPENSRTIDEEENSKQGLYHLRIGADVGIVKSIQFSRESNAAIQTSNIMKAYNKGGASLGILRLPYQATVGVVGNAFFQPGQYVYIDPTTVGPLASAERREIASDLIGLGGFYLITKVSSIMEAGKFNTTLECKFETYGYFPNENKNKAVGGATTPVGEGDDAAPESAIGDPDPSSLTDAELEALLSPRVREAAVLATARQLRVRR